MSLLRAEDSGSRNAWSLSASRELENILKEHRGQFRALLFKSIGRVFCSGGHLTDYASLGSAGEGHAINTEIAAGLSLLSEIPVPTVCAVGGDCFGGGVELASCFDVVIANPHVVFALWQRRIGLTYGWGGGARLERKLAPDLVRAWALSTRPWLASELHNLGWLNELVPRARLDARAFDLAVQLAEGSLNSVAGLKAFLPEREKEIFKSLWWGDDHKKALELFVKSRRT